MHRLIAIFVLALAALGQQPEAERFYEELIRTPLVPQRSRDDIRADRKAAEQELQHLNKTITDYQARVNEAAGWVTTQKSEFQALEKKIKAAKKEKREADKFTLEAQRKQLQLVEDYLKQINRVRNVELSVAKSQKELLNTEMKVYQAELNLKNKVEAMDKGEASDPDLAKTTIDAAQEGETTLRLMKSLTDKNVDVAGRMKQLADRRVTLVQARNKLISEQRIRKAAASRGQR